MSSENINIFPKYNNCNYFIEGGSYKGNGIQNAIEAGFKNIISIEITKYYYDLCVEKFKDNPNVKIIFGDTTKILPELLKEINEKCVFWLDSHYSDPSTEYGDKMSPILDELDIITEHCRKYNDTILIDDRRCWSKSDWNYQNYLFTSDDIEDKIKEINSDYEISYDIGFIPDDVIAAQIPKNNKIKKSNKKRK
jgi:hypothetical protein